MGNQREFKVSLALTAWHTHTFRPSSQATPGPPLFEWVSDCLPVRFLGRGLMLQNLFSLGFCS